MVDGRVKLFSSDISLISHILIIHLLILTVRDAEYYKSGYHYSRQHLETTGTTTELVKAFILLPSPLMVPNKRTNSAFMACRVPYDVSGICSFQLNKLSGDVYPNSAVSLWRMSEVRSKQPRRHFVRGMR